MTAAEKASQLRYDAPGIDRLGIPAYNWWNEALHGVARAGTATVFPQAIALAAIFDGEYLGEIAEIIAEEARAKYNMQQQHGDRDIYKGLTFWTPNINICRDPRWGRGHETYGEDPYLTTRLGVAFIKGLQGDGPVMKAAACAKHYAVHSGPEAIRHEFDAVATPKDMWETYLPAFEAAVKEAGVESVMGAYNRTTGEPCCGSKTLLVDILREKWGFDGHVVSDCWAIRDFHTTHLVTGSAPESAALALQNGGDLNCGCTYVELMTALEAGLITEEQLTVSAERMMATRIKLGMFDGGCEFDSIPYEVNDCAAHNDKSLEAARKSMVLLKNNGILPLNKSKLKSIAVIGPNADNQMMLKGNYYGTASEYVTVLEGIREAVGESVRVYYSEGCHLFRDKLSGLSAYKDDRLAEVKAICEEADAVVLCLGMDSDIEGEQGDAGNAEAAGDKRTLELPGRQQKLLETVTASGKPVVLVLGVGSALGIGYAQEHCDAILNAWYPGSKGGRAVADILFGKCSPGGKLPVTFYNSIDDLPAFTDYAMTGRTYRYFTGEPLYPFGYGLTYSKTEVSSSFSSAGKAGEPLSLTVSVKNTGEYDVEEVVQCYIKNVSSEYATVNPSLCAFKRVALKAGESKDVTLTVAPSAFEVVNGQGERIMDGNEFKIYVGLSQPDERSVALMGQRPVSFDYSVID
jgi:beta-glucosidase